MKTFLLAILALSFSLPAFAAEPGIYSVCGQTAMGVARKTILEIDKDMKLSIYSLTYSGPTCEGDAQPREFGPLTVKDEEINDFQWKTTVYAEGIGYYVSLRIRSHIANLVISRKYPVEHDELFGSLRLVREQD